MTNFLIAWWAIPSIIVAIVFIIYMYKTHMKSKDVFWVGLISVIIIWPLGLFVLLEALYSEYNYAKRPKHGHNNINN